MIHAKNLLFAVVLSGLLGGAAAAQEQPNFPKPQEEHQFLKKFVGHWTTTSKGSASPDAPECRGSIESKMLGDFWVVNKIQNDVEGFSMHGLQTIGYDSVKRKYVGTWVDSMFNHLWIYEGTVDESGNKLTLEAEGPNFMEEGGKLTKFRDTYEFKTPDHIIATSYVQQKDGTWVTMMAGECKRKPADEK